MTIGSTPSTPAVADGSGVEPIRGTAAVRETVRPLTRRPLRQLAPRDLDRTRPSAPAVYGDSRNTVRTRLIISGLSLLALVTGLLGLTAGLDGLRIVGFGVYLLFGLGAAPGALSRYLRWYSRLFLGAVVSLSALVLISTTMLQTGQWRPALAASVLMTITGGLHIAGLVIAIREQRSQRQVSRDQAGPGPDAASDDAAARPHWTVRFPPALLLAGVGGIACAVAALTHRHIQPGFWGFLVEIGPLWYVGLALVIVALATVRHTTELSTAIAVVILLLIFTGTPALVYDGPRSQSASKHLEFVEQIQVLHHMHSTVAVYNSWPGYFSAMAWLSDVTGVHDGLHLATVWPVLIGLLRLIAMRYLAGQIITDRSQVWFAVALGVLADPIGADYFSPQSLGFVVGVAAFGIALSRLRLWPKLAALTAAGWTMTVSHQLSPYIVGGCLIILVAFRYVRPWYAPVAVLGPAAIWAVLHWADLSQFLSLGDAGNTKNFRPPVTIVTPGLARLPIVRETVVALLAGVLLVGLVALVVVVRRRRHVSTWAIALCPAVGLSIVAVNPYGNEGIFRAILFALPWLAILAGQAFRPALASKVHLPLLALIVALAVTFSTAAYGLDATNVLRPQDREAFRLFQAANPESPRPSYLLVLGPGDLPSSPPTQARLHESVKRDRIDATGFMLVGRPPAVIADQLTRRYVYLYGARTDKRHLYAMWSPVSRYYGWQYGIHTPQQFTGLRDAFLRSPSWKSIYTSRGTVLFQYVPPARKTAPARKVGRR